MGGLHFAMAKKPNCLIWKLDYTNRHFKKQMLRLYYFGHSQTKFLRNLKIRTIVRFNRLSYVARIGSLFLGIFIFFPLSKLHAQSDGCFAYTTDSAALSLGLVLAPSPEQLGCIEHSMEVSGFPDGLTWEDLPNSQQNLFINFEHSWMGDVSVEFTCPEGNQLQTVLSNPGGGYVGFPTAGDWNPIPGTGALYTWSPYATNGPWGQGNLVQGVLPPGTYESMEPFFQLDGCSLNGTWTVVVCDQIHADNGFLFFWGVAGQSSSSIIPCNLIASAEGPESDCEATGVIRIEHAEYVEGQGSILHGQLWLDGNLYSEQSGDSLIEWTELSQGEYQVALQLIADEALDLGTETIVLEPIFTPEASNSDVLCAVAFDGSTGRNKVVWTKDDNVMIATYEVQRESNITSEFETIGTVHSDSLSEFIDSEFDPSYSSARYNLVSVDSCGNAIDNSINYHRTIHLQANSGVNGEVNLYWNPYEGISYPNFEIHRSQDGENYFLIGSVSNSTYAFTDPSPPSGDKWYQIRISLETPCEPIRTTEFIGSNISDLSALAVQAAAIETLGVSIVQSQESPLLTWRHARGGIEARVFDSSGRELMAETSSGASGTIALNRLTASGENAAFYLVRVTERSGGSTKVLRFVYVP